MKLSELDAAFESAMRDSLEEYQWYDKYRRRYVVFSFLTRGLAAVTLVFGVLLPLSTRTDQFSLFGATSFFGLGFAGPAEAAVACLALAGLVIGANQIFMISSTWVRYANAMMRIKTLQMTARLDWDAQKADLVDPVSQQDVQKAFALFKSVIIGSRQVVEAETASWGSELVKAVEQLQTLVGQQRGTVDTLAREEQKTREAAEKAGEAAQKLAMVSTHGTVRVKIEGAIDRLTGRIKVTASTLAEVRDAPVPTIVLTEVLGGIQKVTLVGSDRTGKPILVENAVQVAPNSITDVALIVPEA